MYRNNRFCELLKGLPRKIFEKAVIDSDFDKYSKCFHAWDHLVAIMYGQISGSKSLRELETGFNRYLSVFFSSALLVSIY